MKTKVEKTECLNDECVDDALLGFDDATTMDRDWSGNERWTPEKTRLMLELRFERQSQFQKKERQKKEIWAEIAAEMKQMGGFVLSGESCDLKYRNMLQTYKKNRLKEERGQQSMIVWEFYDIFKEAMRTCSDMMMDDLVPSMLCESVCIGEDDAMNTTDNLLEIMQSQMQQTTTGAVRERSSGSGSGSGKSRLQMQAVKVEATQEVKTRSTRSSKRHRSPLVSEIMGNNVGGGGGPTTNADGLQTADDIGNSLSESLLQTTSTESSSHHRNKQQKLSVPIPVGLTGSELFECQTFGDSIGLQLAHVNDAQTRAYLQLKIQELIYLAKMGKLSDGVPPNARIF